MKKVIFVLSIMALMGCATAKNVQLHNGEPGFLIDCSGQFGSIANCENKAKDVCPAGYNVTHIFPFKDDDREMIIQCRNATM